MLLLFSSVLPCMLLLFRFVLLRFFRFLKKLEVFLALRISALPFLLDWVLKYIYILYSTVYITAGGTGTHNGSGYGLVTYSVNIATVRVW